MPLPVPPPDAFPQIEALVASTPDDEALRDALSARTDEPWLPAIAPHFGPSIYERNPAVFRLLLLSLVDAYCSADPPHASDVWRGPEGGRLEAWLDAADRDDDVETFRVLYRWRLGSLPEGQRAGAWRRELIQRFESAGSEAARASTLDKMAARLVIDEPTAVALYERDPDATPRFLRRHLPTTTGEGEGEGYWASLSSLARVRRDQDLFFAIYRKTVEAEQWAKDVELLADRMEDGGALTIELMRRHPEADRRNVSSVLYSLLRKRGEAVMPYVLQAVQRSAAGLQAEPARHGDLIRLADERGWLQLWTRLLRATGREGDIDREVRRLVDDQRRGDSEILLRLDRLARLRPTRDKRGADVVLSDETAVKTYVRFPDTFRVQLRHRLRVGPFGYTLLLDKAVRKRDELLVDWLASLVVVVDMRQEWARREAAPMLDVLLEAYGSLRDQPGELAGRAARVLGFVPPGAVPASGYDGLAESNKLAAWFRRLEPSVWLASDDAVRDLLEAPDVHARHLAVRLLRADDAKARATTLDNVGLLKAALSLTSSRRLRRDVLAALENAADEEPAARAIVTALREIVDAWRPGPACDDAVATLGRVIHRHPVLRLPSELSSFEVPS